MPNSAVTQSASRKRTGLQLAALCLVAGLGYWLRGIWSGAPQVSLLYRVALSRIEEGILQVDALARADRPLRRFVALVPEKAAEHSRIRFSGCTGQDLDFKTSMTGAGNADFLSFEAREARDCIRFAYEVRIGKVEVSNNGNKTGYVYGAASRELVTAHGGQLLIVPAEVPRSSPARIEWERLPDGFLALPPLGDTSNGAPARSFDIGSLADASLAAGRLEALGGEVYLQSSMDERSKRLAREVIDWLQKELPGSIPSHLAICLIGKSRDGYDVFVPDSAEMIVMTMDPPVESRVRRLAERVIASVLAKVRTDPGSSWYFQGLAKHFSSSLARRFFAARGREPIGLEPYRETYPAKSYDMSVSQLESLDTEAYPLTYERLAKRSAEMVRRLDLLRAERGLAEGFLLEAAMESMSSGEAVRRVLEWSQKSLEDLEKEVKRLGPSGDSEPPLQLSESPQTPFRGSPSTVSLLFTGGIQGYLENCGCSVNQSGGLDKQIAFASSFRREFPDAVLLDLGNLLAEDADRSLSDETRRQMKIYSALAARLDYDALAVASSEIYNLEALLADEFLPSSRYISLNLAASGDAVFKRSRLVERTDPSVLLVSAFDPAGAHQPLPALLEDRLAPYDYALDVREIRRVIQEKGDGALTVLFGHFSAAAVQAILKQIPELDVLIWNSQEIWERPDLSANGFYRDTLVLPGGLLGSYGLQAVHLNVSDQGRVLGYTLKHIELDSSHEADREAKEEIGRLYRSFYTDSPAADGRPGVEGLYVGAESCQPCHASQFKQWQGTKHAHAYITLVEKRRNYAPECLGCHVAGYKKARFEFDQLKEFGGVQCESCHGPALDHVRSSGHSPVKATMKMEECAMCHQPERSPNFPGRFSEKFTMIRH